MQLIVIIFYKNDRLVAKHLNDSQSIEHSAHKSDFKSFENETQLYTLLLSQPSKFVVPNLVVRKNPRFVGVNVTAI